MRWLALLLCLLASPASAQLALTGAGGSGGAGALTILSVTPSSGTFTAGTTGTYVISAVGVTMSIGSFTGTLAITGTNSGGFLLSSTTLPSNLTCPSTCPTTGTYADFNIVATQAGAVGSPLSQAVSLVGGSPAVPFNPSDKSASITLSNVNLTASNPADVNWSSVRSTTSHSSGKYYFEITPGATGAGTNGVMVGLADASASLSSYLGSSTHGYAWQNNISAGTGLTWYNATHTDTFYPCNVGQTCGYAVDLTAKKVWVIRWAGGGWNAGLTPPQDPNTPSGGYDISGVSGNIFFGFSGQFTANAATVTVNVGGTSYVGTVPTGYSNW